MTRALSAAAAVCLAAAALLAAAPGQGNDAFPRLFEDATLRIDYYRVGNAKEEVVTIDRVLRQGPWAGSRRHLVDTLDNGGSYVKIYDEATGELIFSRGFDTYFGEYRTSSPALAGVRRTYHESVLVPLPKKPFRFVLEGRGRDKVLREVFAAPLDPAQAAPEPPAPGVTVVEVHRTGPAHERVDVALVGEGYTAAEEPKFRRDAARYAQLLLSHEPFARHKDRFNVVALLRPSQDSGCDEPSRGVFRSTSVSATFDSLGSERYLLTEDNRALRDIAANAPYDALYIMVNHARYGGGGIYNLFCTFTTDNQWSPYVFLHEFGHSFAGLADEYYTSSVAYNEFYPRGTEPTEPNITAFLPGRSLKWDDLKTPGTAVPTPWEKAAFESLDREQQKVREEKQKAIAAAMKAGAPPAEVARLKEEAERLSQEHARAVDALLAKSAFAGKVGAFEGAGYAAEGLYRPALDCIMFSKGEKPFCPVCERGIERVIERFTE